MSTGPAHSPQFRDPRSIVVVGPCGSGKTTIVNRLTMLGYNARAVGQEHSIIRDLWNRSSPDVVVALDTPLSVVRTRRSPDWPAAIYDAQHERLARAFRGADIRLDTGTCTVDEAVASIVRWLQSAA